VDVDTIAHGHGFKFNTEAGPLDCTVAPAGANGFNDLMSGTLEMAFDDVHAFFAPVMSCCG
jgi:hypothetical protein